MARPTKWTKELEAKGWDYVNGKWETVDAMPSVVGLAHYLGITRETCYAWEKDKGKQFSDMLRQINTDQERILFNKALTGDYNAAIAKLALTKHGYSDKSDSTISGGIAVTAIERTIVKAKDTDG